MAAMTNSALFHFSCASIDNFCCGSRNHATTALVIGEEIKESDLVLLRFILRLW